MARPYVVYGQKGTGSVPVEATLLLLGERYELVERADWDQGNRNLPRRRHFETKSRWRNTWSNRS